jgi:hypothetical protein
MQLPRLPYSLVTVCHKTGFHGVIPGQLACERYVTSSFGGCVFCNECFLQGTGMLNTTGMSAIFMQCLAHENAFHDTDIN